MQIVLPISKIYLFCSYFFFNDFNYSKKVVHFKALPRFRSLVPKNSKVFHLCFVTSCLFSTIGKKNGSLCHFGWWMLWFEAWCVKTPLSNPKSEQVLLSVHLFSLWVRILIRIGHQLPLFLSRSSECVQKQVLRKEQRIVVTCLPF